MYAFCFPLIRYRHRAGPAAAGGGCSAGRGAGPSQWGLSYWQKPGS